MSRAASALLISLTLIACGEEPSPSPDVRISDEPPGLHCATGGSRVDTIVDGAASTLYVCNGADGSRTTVTVEPAGARCAAGGVRVESAAGASYVCTGGALATAGTVSVTPEPAGAHCAAGGYALATATAVQYVCNGVDGADARCEDTDGDGYWAGCASYDDTRPGPDCDDGDAASYQVMAGYADQDLDGVTAGPARAFCGAGALPIELRATPSVTPDCNDADPAVAADCDRCVDADGDGFYAGCDQYALHAGPDCEDADSLISPATPELPDDGKDNDCAGDGDLHAVDGSGIFVATTGSDNNAGTRARPKRTLLAALNAANPSGRVYVAGGYFEDAQPGATTVMIFGGYQPGNWDVRDPARYQSKVQLVVTSDGADRRVVIDGFTLNAINAFSSRPVFVSRTSIGPSALGGSSLAMTIVQCTLTSGATPLRIDGGQLTLIDSTVTATSTSTAIVMADQSRARLVHNTVVAQSGISLRSGSSAVIERNQITVAGANSNGLRSDGSGNTLLVRGNVFRNGDEAGTTARGVDLGADLAYLAGNVFRDDGAKRYVALDLHGTDGARRGHVELINNVVAARQTRINTGVRVGAGTEVTAVNNVVALGGTGNAVEVTGGDVWLGLYHNDLVAPAGCLVVGGGGDDCAVDAGDVNAWHDTRGGARGNLSAAPGFVDAAAGDFHLRPDSPLVDRGYDVVAGDVRGAIDRSRGPLAVSLVAAQLAVGDVDGQARSGAWDIGVDEAR